MANGPNIFQMLLVELFKETLKRLLQQYGFYVAIYRPYVYRLHMNLYLEYMPSNRERKSTSLDFSLALLLVRASCMQRWHAVSGAGAARAGDVVTEDSWSQHHHSGRRQDDTQQHSSAVLRQFHLTRPGMHTRS